MSRRTRPDHDLRHTLAGVLCAMVMPVGAEPPPADIAAKDGADEANRRELREIHDPRGHLWSMPTPDEYHARELEYRRHAQQQRQLQETQRHELLMLNQRARTAPPNVPGWRLRLDAINRQRQMQMDQLQQLQRFRAQPGLR